MGKHWPGTVLRKKARRKGFRGCIQTVLDGPVEGFWHSSRRPSQCQEGSKFVLLGGTAERVASGQQERKGRR